MSTLGLSGAFESTRYNRLVSPEEADYKVRATGVLERVLDDACRLFAEHNETETFGLALLHKHNICPIGTRMIESQERVLDEDALVARVVHSGLRSDDAVPVLWQFCDGTYHPMEFSTDVSARRSNAPEVKRVAFLRGLGALLERHSATTLLALAVVERDFYGSAKSNEVPVEFSTEEPANIVVLRNRTDVTASTIEPSWKFDVSAEAARVCNKVCTKYCVTITGSHTSSHGNMHSGSSS